jgi:hypothetical protein
MERLQHPDSTSPSRPSSVDQASTSPPPTARRSPTSVPRYESSSIHPLTALTNDDAEQVYLLCLDCRSERTREVICTTTTYDAVFGAIRKLPAEVEHLVVLLGTPFSSHLPRFQLTNRTAGVPIAYPRMNTIETILGGKFSPLALLGKTKALGMGGLVNNFNKEAELLDDLNDHWTVRSPSLPHLSSLTNVD